MPDSPRLVFADPIAVTASTGAGPMRQT